MPKMVSKCRDFGHIHSCTLAVNIYKGKWMRTLSHLEQIKEQTASKTPFLYLQLIQGKDGAGQNITRKERTYHHPMAPADNLSEKFLPFVTWSGNRQKARQKFHESATIERNAWHLNIYRNYNMFRISVGVAHNP